VKTSSAASTSTTFLGQNALVHERHVLSPSLEALSVVYSVHLGLHSSTPPSQSRADRRHGRGHGDGEGRRH